MVIKVKQPKRDAQGKTKVDRDIAARKAAQGKTSTPAPAPAPTPSKKSSSSSRRSSSSNTSQLSQQELTNLDKTGTTNKARNPVQDLPELRESTTKEKLAGTGIGQFATGFIGGADPGGRSLNAQAATTTLGRLTSFATTLAGISGLGAAGQAITDALAQSATNKAALNALEAIRLSKAYKVIRGKNALRLAERIGTGSKVANIGINVGGKTAVVASNAVTKTLLSKMLIGSGFTIGAVYLLKDGYESFTFGGFQINEAMDNIKYARSEAREAGDQTLVDDLNNLQDDILNPVGWEKVMANLPWATAQRATKKNLDAAEAAAQVYKKLDEDRAEQIATGQTDEDYWKQRNLEQAEQEKANIDYYNQERKKMVAWETESNNADRNADAKYWANQASKQRKLEKADRKAIADFWNAYRKQAQEIADNSRPSNLNFGLI